MVAFGSCWQVVLPTYFVAIYVCTCGFNGEMRSNFHWLAFTDATKWTCIQTLTKPMCINHDEINFDDTLHIHWHSSHLRFLFKMMRFKAFAYFAIRYTEQIFTPTVKNLTIQNDTLPKFESFSIWSVVWRPVFIEF